MSDQALPLRLPAPGEEFLARRGGMRVTVLARIGKRSASGERRMAVAFAAPGFTRAGWLWARDFLASFVEDRDDGGN